MNITFLIGNGFDLNLGLNTLYSDFIKDYKVSTTQFEVINGNLTIIPQNHITVFKHDIASNEKNWSNAEEEFGKYTSGFYGENGLNQFLDCHEDFCKELSKYLEKEEKRIDFSVFEKKIVDEFKKAIFNTLYGLTEEQSLQVKKCYDNTGSGFNFNFISFNYTSTLDNCVNMTRNKKDLLGNRNFKGSLYENSIGELIHVHGYTYKEMALGLNDESQIENKYLFENCHEEDKAQIIKRLTNKINEQRVDEKTVEILEQSDFIYIYGMSIGSTDAIWWQRICNLMIKKSSLQIVIHQYDAPDVTLFRRNYVKYERELRTHFISFLSNKDIDVSSLINRIHITKANIFEGISKIADDKNMIISSNKNYATIIE